MTSTIKVNTITTESGSTLTVGGCGKTVALASGASQTGFGRTGTVDWQTSSIKTSTFTAVDGQGFFVDTTGGSVTANLPAGAGGSIVAFADYTNTFSTANSLVIAPNGSDKIGGTNASATVTTEGISITLIFIDSTEGWKIINDATNVLIGETFMAASGGTETTSGDFKIHKFTGPGTFTVSSIGNLDKNNTVSYVVVGGGGGGMSMIQNVSEGGGGGGAGGYRENKSPVDTYTASPVEGSTDVIVTATSFPITIGAGGPGSGTVPTGSNPGSASTFGTITSAGGGGVSGGNSGAGIAGGSGGGGSANCGAGGAGNTPPVSPAQGNPGGSGYNAAGNPAGSKYGAGGGGGATGTGFDGCGAGASANSGKGGLGATSSITASPVLYAEGGGGANYCNPSSPPGLSQGSGGNAGYGPYPNGPNMSGQAGTVNTGGGGGGGSNANSGGPTANGGAGGSGIVIIRYKFQ